MTIRPLATALVLLAAASLSAASAQEGMPKPTAEHKVFEHEAGVWDAKIKSYMGGPDAEPAESTGSETNTVGLGGFWMLSKFEGDMGGMKFEGRGQFGYDPQKKKYVGTWIDSMNPTLSVLEGKYDSKSKTMTYTGDGYDPMSKSKYTQKMVTTLNEDGTRRFTLYMKGDVTGGKEAKVMEVVYTKRK